MRVWCKVLVVLVLLLGGVKSERGMAIYGFGKAMDSMIKVGGVAIVGLASFGMFTSVRGCMLARDLRNPDFLQMRQGSAVNHYSQISRYDVEKKDPQVQDYLKIAAREDVELVLHLRDEAGNSSIATLVDFDKHTVEVELTDDGGLSTVPLAQVSGVALYNPDTYGSHIAVGRNELIPLYPEDVEGLSFFNKYHARVVAQFSDGYQLVSVFAAMDTTDGVDSDGWLLGLDRGINAMTNTHGLRR